MARDQKYPIGEICQHFTILNSLPSLISWFVNQKDVLLDNYIKQMSKNLETEKDSTQQFLLARNVHLLKKYGSYAKIEIDLIDSEVREMHQFFDNIINITKQDIETQTTTPSVAFNSSNFNSGKYVTAVKTPVVPSPVVITDTRYVRGVTNILNRHYQH